MDEIQNKIIGKVLAERERQDAKWGVQHHDPSMWLNILGEEYGESCQAFLEHHFGNKSIDDYAKEMKETAAVAIAALENLERVRSEQKVYLAGPIADCDDGETYQWREVASDSINTKCINPAVGKDFRGKKIDDAQSQVIIPDKSQIDKCRVLLANCWKVSVGTSMEILYAWERGKHVVSILPDGVPRSPWTTGHSHFIASNLQEAIEHINELVNNGQEKE